MPVMFLAAVQRGQARSGLLLVAAVMASAGMAAAISGSDRPDKAAIRSGVWADHPRVSSVAGVNDRVYVAMPASASRWGIRRLLS